MIARFNANQLFRLHECSNERFELSWWTKLIARSAHKELGLGAIAEKPEIVDAVFDGHNRQTKGNERADAVVGISGAQSHRSAERKSREDDWQREFMRDPVKSSVHILDFAFAASVLAFAQSGAAKIEAQDRKSEAVERLHGVKDDFVVQRSAVEGMRVTNQRCMRRTGYTSIQQGFEAANWAVEEERADGSVLGKQRVVASCWSLVFHTF